MDREHLESLSPYEFWKRLGLVIVCDSKGVHCQACHVSEVPLNQRYFFPLRSLLRTIYVCSQARSESGVPLNCMLLHYTT